MDFETSKSVNPFLMDDATDYGVAQNGAASSNPFLSSDFGAEPTGTDNPFLTSSYNENFNLPDTNPFATFGADYGDAANAYPSQNDTWQQPAQELASMEPQSYAAQQPAQVAQKPFIAEPEPRPNELELITTTTSNINDPENDLLLSSDEEGSRPKRPPPPHPTMAKETQDLILSVTGALEATSHHLLDRLPPTRAPSPTAFPDFQSFSPTPDTFTDLLGTAQPPQSNLPQFPSNDDFSGLAKPEKAAPPRPPPARPAPPKPAPPSQPPKPQPEDDDMFDLFGTSKPPPPKSKDAILNLYSQPSKPPPKDLLTDDLDMPGPTMSLMENEVKQEDKTASLLSSEVLQEPSQPQVQKAEKVVEPAPQVTETIESFKPAPAAPAVTNQPENNSFGFESQNDIFGVPKLPENKPPAPRAEKPLETERKQSLVASEEPPFLFGTKPQEPPSPQEPTIFGTRPQEPLPSPEPTIFGTGPQEPLPPQEPTIFGTGPQEPLPPQEPTIFGTGPQEQLPPQEPTIFGTGPQEQLPPQEPTIFGTGSQEPIAPQEHTIFGTGPQESIPPQEHTIFGTRPQEPVPPQQPTIFGTGPPEPVFASDVPIFGTTKVTRQPPLVPERKSNESFPKNAGFGEPQPSLDAFDAFAAKFESTGTGFNAGGDLFDPFSGAAKAPDTNAWGSVQNTDSVQQGFGTEDTFDAFLSMSQPTPAPRPTPNKLHKTESGDSEEGGFNVFIKPREGETPGVGGVLPVLAPPPKSPVGNSAFNDNDSRFNPFDKGDFSAFSQEGVQFPPLSQTEPYEGGFKRSDSQETPPTPLFDEDVSQPLEEFPRINYTGDGWEMQLRQPNKKKITGQRFWKKIFVKLVYQGDNPVLQLFNVKEDKDPFQELPLQACYSVSDISAQQYDQFGKIFTVKLQYIFYKERPGVRPGQVTKAERITNKLSQFAAYAIQGDYQGVKEFGSDLKKLGLPVEHAPQISQLLKIGSMSFEDLKQFSVTLEECLFRMPVHRDRALNYKMEEVQITVVDEIYVEQDALGHVGKQIARVRLFFLGFLSGMPDVELGLNDMWRQGKEVVGRHDIIPVVTEEWIRLEAVEFHSCIQQEEYEKTRTIKFKPPDACYIELMRFRIRPPRNRELPLQLKAVMCITGSKVELRADVLVPGFASRKLGQIPCEDVMIRFPIPECWIYLFRVEKHFRYGSVKSAHRRTGKIKGIERFLGAVDTMEPSLMEVTSGQAKYEHQHRSLVWRMPRLPKEGQGAYTTHNLVCRMQLTSFDQIPDNLAEYAYVEFTMPATQASHTTVRSVSLCDSPSDNPPEKYVRQLARHEYRVGIEHVHTEETAAYEAATIVKPKPVPETVPEVPPPPAESDSDSSD